jgi:ketosteroid isomerase-like protein
MDPERASLIDSFYAALARRDVEGVLSLCDDDVELYQAPGVEETTRVPQGHERVAGWLRGWLDSWERYEPTVDDLRESGDDVVSLVTVRARGRGSSFDIDEEVADVFRVRDDKIVRLRLHVSREEALRDSGL